MTDAELTILKTELDSDPELLGYTTDDPYCVELLNEIRSGASYQLPNTSVLVSDVLDAIDASEVSAVEINGLQLFLARMQTVDGTVDISAGAPIIGQAAEIFTEADAPNSRAALYALINRDASRAEILFGAGVTVIHLDAGQARLI